MLGETLKAARHQAGLTQEELAARAKLSREYVSKLERGQQSPTVDTLFRTLRHSWRESIGDSGEG